MLSVDEALLKFNSINFSHLLIFARNLHAK